MLPSSHPHIFIQSIRNSVKMAVCTISSSPQFPTPYITSSSASNNTIIPFKLPLFWPWNKIQKVKVGPLSISPMGFGTWAWGNQLLLGYHESMDNELQQDFNLALDNGINLFDTADSYGTGKLNGQSEKFLGKFISDYKVGPLSISPMWFGTWAWGNQLLWGYHDSMDNELQQVFNLALDNGINLFDTADSYGTGKLNGQSEKLLGKFISEYKEKKRVQDGIVIATKFAAYPWRLTLGQFVDACKSSLERLQVEQIGIAQLHWSTANYAPFQEKALWDGLVAMHEKGLVQAVGVSNYGPRQLVKINSYLKDKGVPLRTAQVQFSLLSYGDEQMEIMNVCNSLGVQLIAYSPLGLGMLTGKYTTTNLPKGPRGLLFNQILPGLDPLLSCLRGIAARRQKTTSQIAINWCISKGTIPIPGVKSMKQAQEKLGALGWRLSSNEVAELEDVAHQSPRKMIQNIFQTS